MNSKSRLILAFAAGMAGSMVAGSTPWKIPLASAQEPSAENTSSLNLTDAAGRTYARLAAGAGQTGRLTFYNAKGDSVLVVGVEADGKPRLSLWSPTQRRSAKFILQVTGANDSATLIFKDNRGRDRMLMGLDPDGPSENPFLVTFDKNMTKATVFGAR